MGSDGFDWIELKSGEWLKGRLVYVQKKKVELDSEKLDRQKFDLKDVRGIYPARPMNVKFEDLQPVFTPVTVQAKPCAAIEQPERMEMPRDELTGITPGGLRERDYWSGEFALGFDLEAGNTRQANLSASLSMTRRTPATRFDLDYVGNYSEANEVTNAQDQRLNVSYDIFLDKGFFVRPIGAEYYRDPLANIDSRVTVGVALGYSIFDRDDLEWFVAVGPSYQKTWFVDVPAGEDDTASSPGLSLQTKFKKELTNKVDLIFEYGGIFTTPDSGSYSQHVGLRLKLRALIGVRREHFIHLGSHRESSNAVRWNGSQKGRLPHDRRRGLDVLTKRQGSKRLKREMRDAELSFCIPHFFFPWRSWRPWRFNWYFFLLPCRDLFRRWVGEILQGLIEHPLGDDDDLPVAGLGRAGPRGRDRGDVDWRRGDDQRAIGRRDRRRHLVGFAVVARGVGIRFVAGVGLGVAEAGDILARQVIAENRGAIVEQRRLAEAVAAVEVVEVVRIVGAEHLVRRCVDARIVTAVEVMLIAATGGELVLDRLIDHLRKRGRADRPDQNKHH